MKNSAKNLSEASHTLYSKGYVFDEYDYFDALRKISEVTRKSQVSVQKHIVCCKTRPVTSSTNLKKLKALESTLKNVGLDVYIEAH